MSLILRKECQVVLDNAGLPNFHVAINTNSYNRNLSIVGECGKPFMEIHGIVFSRSIPTKAEIQYAVTLLEAFLVKYKRKIDKYIKAKKTNGPRPEDPRFSSGYYNDVSYVDNNVEINVRTYLKKPMDIMVRPDLLKMSIDDIDNFKHDKTLYKDAIALSKKIRLWEIEDQKVTNLKSKLSECNI